MLCPTLSNIRNIREQYEYIIKYPGTTVTLLNLETKIIQFNSILKTKTVAQYHIANRVKTFCVSGTGIRVLYVLLIPIPSINVIPILQVRKLRQSAYLNFLRSFRL